MSLLDRVKKLCSEKGISQRKLEQALGLGNGASSKWSKSSPSSDLLQKIAEYFEVSTDYLIGNDEIDDMGRVIKEERKFQSLTQEDLAQKIAISQEELADYEEDIEPISEYVLEKICRAFDMSIPALRNKYGLYDEQIPSHFNGDVDKWENFKKARDEDAKREKYTFIDPIESISDVNIRAIARAGEQMSKEDTAELKKFAERLFPDAFKKNSK